MSSRLFEHNKEHEKLGLEEDIKRIAKKYGFPSGGGSGGIVAEEDPIWTAEKQNYYTKTETDNSYVKKAGDTMSGTLDSRSIIPTSDDSYDLGSAGHRYKNVYALQLITGSLNFTGTATIAPNLNSSNPGYNLILKSGGSIYANSGHLYLGANTSIYGSRGTVKLGNDSTNSYDVYLYNSSGILSSGLLKNTNGLLGVAIDGEDYLSPLQIADNFEPIVSAGTSAKYYRGDKTWQTLNQAAVSGLTTSDSPSFAGGTYNGRLSIYCHSASESNGLYLGRNITNASYIVGISSNIYPTTTGTADNTGSYYGMTFGVTTQSASTAKFAGSIYGFQGFSYHDANVELGSAYGCKFGVRVTRSGNVNMIYGSQILSGFSAAASNSYVWTVIHTEINEFFNSGTNCSIGNQYGLLISAMTTATNNYAIMVKGGNIVFNEDGRSDSDLRVEGDTDANLLFVDAGADRVGIGLSNPSYKLDVNGDVRVPAGSAYYVGTSAGVSGSFTSADGKTITVTKGIITAIA